MTANRIQNVALKYFSEKGYDGTSLSEIATEVGIKKPSIYAHYTSKHELFLAVVRDVGQEYREYRQQLLKETESLDFEQRLYHIFQAIITYFSRDRVKMAFWVRVWMFPPAQDKETILALWRSMNSSFVDEIAAIFEQGMSQGVIKPCTARDMAYSYLCLLDGCLMRVICYTDVDYVRHMPHIWGCFWAGAKVGQEE